SYATRHPGHPGALILVSTAARIDFDIMYAAFERIGGSEIRKLAEDYWSNPTDESRKAYRETCVPYYTVQNINWPELIGRAVVRDDVSQHFAGPGNEMYRFDFRNDLARISCPTLVMAGVEDPITPPAFSEEIDGHIPRKHVRLERFSQAGHGVVPDRPEEAFSAIRRFIARHLEHLI
ncbi:MAG: alpha/beta hydrolase, partial [Pseudomonadota bacterium]